MTLRTADGALWQDTPLRLPAKPVYLPPVGQFKVPAVGNHSYRYWGETRRWTATTYTERVSTYENARITVGAVNLLRLVARAKVENRIPRTIPVSMPPPTVIPKKSRKRKFAEIDRESETDTNAVVDSSAEIARKNAIYYRIDSTRNAWCDPQIRDHIDTSESKFLRNKIISWQILKNAVDCYINSNNGKFNLDTFRRILLRALRGGPGSREHREMLGICTANE